MKKRHARFLILPLLLFTAFASVSAPRASWARAGGYSDSELLATETPDEAKVRSLRDQEINQLRIALGRRSPASRRADLYLRLAEIYLEAYREEYLLEGRVHEKRLAAQETDKFIDHSHSNPYLSSGIKACKDILNLGIPYDKLDQVYYFLAFNYGEMDERKESLRYFNLLIQKFPESPFVAEAYRELGDNAYAKQDYRGSVQYYELAVKKSGPDTLPRILHKLAWSYYRTREYQRAIDTMKQAISAATRSGERFVSIKEEGLRDMAIFMTETGRVDEAIAYYKEEAGDSTYYPKLLEKLGRQYERNVEPEKATQVYESLLRTSPGSEEAFRVRTKLVDLDLRRGKFDEALNRLKGLDIPTSGESDTLVAAQNLRAMIRRTATEHHEAYRKGGEKSELVIAEKFYTAYLDIFLAKSDPRNETPEIDMYLAEVKRDLGKSQEASALYRKVVDSRDKRYAKEAGALWTASLAEAIHASAHGANANTGAPKATDPSPLEREFVAAADKLQDALGDTNEGREAALKAAQVLAGYKSTQNDAAQRAREITHRSPQSPQGLTAAHLWLQILSDRGATDELRDALKDLHANEPLLATDREQGQGKLAALVAEQETRLKINQIAKSEKEQDFGQAAKGYESFGADSSKKEVVEKAYASAIANYDKAGDAQSVERVAGEWIKRYPNSAKADEAVRTAATRNLIVGRFDVSAQLFEMLGQSGDATSLQTAARLYEGTGNLAHAQQVDLAFLERFKNRSERWSVALTLAKAQEAAHQDNDAAGSYRYCLAGPAEFEAECGMRLADLYVRAGDSAQARLLFKRVAGQGGKHKADSLSPFVGYARFRLAELMERETKLEPLQLPEAALKKAMDHRLAFLEPLSRAYTSAVEAGGPWAVSALDRLASWAIGFADDVDHIAPPAQANAEQIKKFRENLKAISDPLRKKAASTWLDAYRKAVTGEIFSPALPLIADHLADFGADKPVRAQGPRGKLRLAGIAADGGTEGRSSALAKVRDRLVKSPQDAESWADYGNLLWGDGKPLLAKIAYEFSLTLNKKNPAALNNRAAVLINGEGEEDWLKVWEATQLFHDALKYDSRSMTAKANWAYLLNYYRLFSPARVQWEQIAARVESPEIEEERAIALQGSGDVPKAEIVFAKAAHLGGAGAGKFVTAYHEAARASLKGKAGADTCLSRLHSIDSAALAGFEKPAYENLKRSCEQWKNP